jgi:hypothetical protein
MIAAFFILSLKEFCMKRVVVFIVLTMVVINSCTAQSATNEAQRLVGTWTDIEGYKWVFSADGKLKYDDDEYKYSVFDGERGTVLTVFEVYPYLSTDPKDQAYNVDYSRDGKTIRLAGASNLNGWSSAGPGWGTNELVSQADSSSQSNSVINSLFSVTDTALNGTWVDDDVGNGVFESRFDNGKFEYYIDGKGFVKGTYTTSIGKLTTIATHEGSFSVGGSESDWYSMDEQEATMDYSIRGNQLIRIVNGESITSTKKSP